MACQRNNNLSQNAESGSGLKNVPPMVGGLGLRDGGSVMSDREEFEEAAARLGYNLTMAEYETGEYRYPVTQDAWLIWQESQDQAARAQGGQGAEPVAYRVTGSFTDVPFKDESSAKAYCLGLLSSDPEGGYKITPLVCADTHPQPAQQGSVPEGQFMLPKEFLVEYRELVESSDYRPMHKMIRINAIDALLSTHTTPQPEGDGWVKCSERLPTEADADFEYRLWCWLPERKDMKLLLLDQVIQAHLQGLAVLWMPTGLKRPQPPKQEGEGDE